MNIEELYEIYLEFPSVETDTRKLKKGDLFFALKGPNFDGNLYASQALQLGASYAIIDNQDLYAGKNCIVVPDVLTCLQQLALHHRKQLNNPFLAITGSNGKTTTKELINAVLKRKFKVYSTVGNLNNHIGVPLTILRINKDAQFAVIEMGANHQKEIESYCEIALPTHGLITNCGKAHLEGFGSEEGVRKGKGELYTFIRKTGGTIFRNADLPYLESMATAVLKQVTYGSDKTDYVGQISGNEFYICIDLLKPFNVNFATQLAGSYNFPNVLAAITVGLHFQVPISEIKEAIAEYKPDNSRSQWIQKGSNKILMDAYNANPTSMKEAIINFANLDFSGKVLCLGGMKEMGDSEIQEHEDLVNLIMRYRWDEIILVGKEFSKTPQNAQWFPDSLTASEHIKKKPFLNKVILIKGSRGSKMELLLESF